MIDHSPTQVSEVLAYLKLNKKAIFEFLERLVKAESPSNVPEVQHNAQNLIINKLSELDYHTFHISGQKTGGHIYARPKNKQAFSPYQLLVGHSDTVWPVDTIQQMCFHMDTDKIKGPGVFDMKAGLTQILFALECIHALKLDCPVTPLIFINSDEEIGSVESTKYIKWLSKISKRAFILEPPLGVDGKLKTRRKGIGQFSLEITGIAAHAGLDPTKGASAILELSNQIQALFVMNDHKRGISVNVGRIEGGERANVIAPTSKAIIDVRVPCREDAEYITQKIYKLKPSSSSFKIKVSGEVGRMPLEQTERNKILWLTAEEKAKLLGIDLKQAFAGGGSDGNTTSLYTATLDGLGTPGDGAHALHEFAYTDKLLERTALLCLLILTESF